MVELSVARPRASGVLHDIAMVFNFFFLSAWAALKLLVMPLCCVITDRLFCNISGIPNTLNVVSNFPFFVIGVIGLVLCYRGNYFRLRYYDFVTFFLIQIKHEYFYEYWSCSIILIKSLQGELWGWTFFYIGVAAVAFGSSYYHLKPNDARLVWDRLPVSLSLWWKEIQINEKKGTISIMGLLLQYCFNSDIFALYD